MSEPTEADWDTAYRALWPLARYRWPRDDEMDDEQRAQAQRVAEAIAAARVDLTERDRDATVSDC